MIPAVSDSMAQICKPKIIKIGGQVMDTEMIEC